MIETKTNRTKKKASKDEKDAVIFCTFYRISFHSRSARTNIPHSNIPGSEGEKGVTLAHKMLYFHRKNGIQFNYKINLFDVTKPFVENEQNQSKQNTRLTGATWSLFR